MTAESKGSIVHLQVASDLAVRTRRNVRVRHVPVSNIIPKARRTVRTRHRGTIDLTR